MIKKEKWRRSDSNPTSSFKAFSFSVELFSVALSKKKLITQLSEATFVSNIQFAKKKTF